MDDEPWQLRLKALGLSQKAWARLSGQTENTVSRQLREEWKLPRLVRLAILAWERLTPVQRADIEIELNLEDGFLTTYCFDFKSGPGDVDHLVRDENFPDLATAKTWAISQAREIMANTPGLHFEHSTIEVRDRRGKVLAEMPFPLTAS